MRIEEKRIEIYKFEELSEEIKEKLIQQETQSQLEWYCETLLSEDMEEKAQELVKQYFGDKAKFIATYYDLSYTQGRGSMIEFETTYYGVDVRIIQRGFYYHELSFAVDYYGGFLSEKREKKLKEKIYKMNCKLTEFGDSITNDEKMFREQAIEYLQEQEFTADGKIY